VFKLQHKVDIRWSHNFAYAIGLIASDGSLNKDGRHIWFGSKDLEQIKNFKEALGLTVVVGGHARGGEKEKRYFRIHFGDKSFCEYLNQIGIRPTKSKTIGPIAVPNEFFPDFLRGLFDGDGCFYSFWDTRWSNSFAYKMSFASASPKFVVWLKSKLSKLYGVKGYLHKGKGVVNLEYVKGDSKKLFRAMYHGPNLLFLNRKYIKVKTALEKSSELKTAPR